MTNTKLCTIWNRKGGVGKTLLTINIATYLASKGKKVLLIDIDQQANMTSRLYAHTHNCYTLGDCIINNVDISNCILKGISENYKTLDLIPSNADMRYLEELLIKSENKDTVIANYLAANMKYLDQYDYILFDLPPSNNIIGRNILIYTNIVFISEYGNNDSIDMINNYLLEYQEDINRLGLNSNLNFAILINRYTSKKDSSTKLYEQYLDRFEHLKPFILNTKINDSVVMKNANTFRLSVEDYLNTFGGRKTALNQLENIINELTERGVL